MERTCGRRGRGLGPQGQQTSAGFAVLGGKGDPGLKRTAEERQANGIGTGKETFTIRQGDSGARELTEVLCPQTIHSLLLV